MISVFDLKKLESLLADFYEITKIRITVFDDQFNELIAYPLKIAPCCQIIRSTNDGRQACQLCDRKACETTSKKGKTYIYRCHAGLTEAVTPLYVNDILIGYLFFGHVFSYPSFEEGCAAVLECCQDLSIDETALKDALQHQPIISAQYVRSATQILHAVASYLVMERMATLQEDLLAVRLDHYLTEHFAEKLSAETLCKKFGVGKTRLYEISRQLYGCGVAQHLRDMRMARAKELMKTERDCSTAEIAARCGYNDYNYFIAVFTREIGMSPGAWRVQENK